MAAEAFPISEGVARTLVLDSSVAVKFYAREELHEEALDVRERLSLGA